MWPLPPELNWPAAMALAWAAGEIAFRAWRAPRISTYAAVGFVLGGTQSGFLPPIHGGPATALANVALGLVLFELGYRINLRWLKSNPWLGLTSLAEATASFVAVFAVCSAFQLRLVPSLLLAALAISTSPAAVMRVIHERGASGQVTERLVHLTAFNCVLAVVTFKAALGFSIVHRSGDIASAIWNGLVEFLFSGTLGAVFGAVVPAMLHRLRPDATHTTVAFAIAVVLLVALTHALSYSTVLSALVFGLMARHRRTVLSSAERNFGALGDFLIVWLFLFLPATLDWRKAWMGAAVAVAIILVRAIAKTATVTAFSRLSSTTWRKGALSGLALTPISAFVMLLLEPSRVPGVVLMEELAPLAAIVLVLEIAGPWITQRCLVLAGEATKAE